MSTDDHATPTATAIADHQQLVKLVALDVDGTVLTTDHTVTDGTRAAIRDARDGGVTVVLASSRSPLGLRPTLTELGLAHEWFIAYQGALVGRWTPSGDLTVLAETPLARDTARTIERQAEGTGLSVGRYRGTHWRVSTIDCTITREARITGERPNLTPQAHLDHEDAPHKLLVIAGNERLIAQLTAFAAHLPDNVSATFSHATYLEITATGVDKGHGLRALAGQLAIDLDHVVAIGDGLNDLGMFTVAGTSIAMGQAAPAIREAATYVTASNMHDGVAAALTALKIKADASADAAPSTGPHRHGTCTSHNHGGNRQHTT